MRKHFVLAALALGAFTSSGFAAESAAEKALREYYPPQTRVHLENKSKTNGVEIEHYEVTMPNGKALASVTGRGDLLTTGWPVGMAELTPGARETLAVFKTPAQNLTLEQVHAFYVVIDAGRNQRFVAEIDAVGRLKDLKSPEELHDDAKLVPAPAAVVGQIKQVAAKRFKGEQLENVFEASRNPGYYMIQMKNQHGNGWSIMNAQDDTIEYRTAVAKDSLPAAVQATIDKELKNDKILNIQAGGSRLYQVTQTIGGEQITMLITPNGSVDWMNTRQLHRGSQQTEAETIGHRLQGGK
ncbi:MAG TPA: hypothetical protein VH370_14550 [Humisphaera sp.]|jgi:hypothetical protein|nr:hypothetical protein [Humisphaera sp.]